MNDELQLTEEELESMADKPLIHRDDLVVFE